MNSPGQNTGMGSHSLLQRIFPTQGLKPGLPQCKQILYYLSHQRKPKMWSMTLTQDSTVSVCAKSLQFRSVQSLSHVRLFATPWIAASQASLSITKSQSSPKLMSIESVMPSNHLILCHPLLLLPLIFPTIRIFSNESVLHIRWPNYWRFSFSISPSNEYSGLISF